MRPQARCSSRVTWRSSGLGEGLPEGWLCTAHDGRSIQLKSPPDDFPRKHGGAVEGALKHLLHSQDVVPGVQKDYCEDLPVAVPEPARKAAAGHRGSAR